MVKIPQALINHLNQLDCFDEKAFIEAHQTENLLTSIRLNPFKTVDLDFEVTDKVSWCNQAFYLKERPSFTHDPLFHAGAYYVQEAGSMFLEHALKQKVDFSKQIKVLDLCAAPGGKSTAINSLLNKDSLLISNELNKSRADVLAYNLSKWGTFNSIVTNGEVNKFEVLNNFFDVLIVDAPCSGSGLFRKQPDAIDEWSEAHVASCSVRQKKILEEILPTLKESGVLFYSTCSYSVEENESIVKWLIDEQGLTYQQLEIPVNSGIVETELGYRFYPHLTNSEGFFCAVLRKENNSNSIGRNNKKASLIPITKNENNSIFEFISNSNEPIYLLQDRFHMSNQAAHEFISNYQKQFYFRKVGTALGQLKGKDFIPDHDLALSTTVNSSINKVELSHDEAIQFLKKNNFILPQTTHGFALMTYKNLGIGWAKMLPNRFNNYLPNEYKILK